MNSFNIKGNWNEKKGRLQQHFAELTDEDLRLSEGKTEELVVRIQKRLDTTKEEAYDIIRSA